jgi:hypothetical protein
MGLAKTIFVCACIFGLAQPIWSQTGNEVTTSAPTTGTLIFNFTITIKSNNVGSIMCTGNAKPVGFLGDLGISESGSVKATVIGSTAKCTVNVAYSWPLTSPPDSVALSYVLNYVINVEGGESRSSSQSLTNIPVPANSSTTQVAITTTI